MDSTFLLVIPILLPVLGGAAILLIQFQNRLARAVYVQAVTMLNSLLVWALITGWPFGRPEGSQVLFKLIGSSDFVLRLDGLGSVFAGLIATLWPLATLYAFEYMKHEERENSFFTFYTMTYGVTLGIAFSGNLLTMYLFYELLTLVTVPLVMHTMTKEAVRASRKYLYYSLGGAAFAFIGFIFVSIYGTTTDFVYGGVLHPAIDSYKSNVMLAVYVLSFCGFGVKAAIFPFHGWLPSASVAPTPVTALLHAVAVVKSGAFAILRITYFSFGANFLRKTWAQYTVMILVMLTIAYASTTAVRESHFKKRLAYSTISNLSYILLGAVIMTPFGLIAALSHMVFHAVMKICSFFCAGAVMYKTGRHYIYELDGVGRKMPVTFACFTVAALSLTGVPLFAGFISKWNIATAAAGSGIFLAYAAIGVLLYSALMTGIYMLTVVVRAFFPDKGFDAAGLQGISDPSWLMLAPLVIFAAAIVVIGLHSAPLIHLFEQIAFGHM